MKTTIKYLLLFAGWLACSCSSKPNAFDTEMSIVFDETDTLTAQYPTAEAITAPLNLRDDHWQGIRIVLSYISDKDVNQTTVIALPKENAWAGNTEMRTATVRLFISQLQHALSAMKPTGTCRHSIIYHIIEAQANRLALLAAPKKLLLVYSDLKENSAVTFYDRHVLDTLRTSPSVIERRLNGSTHWNALNGLNIWLLYTPLNYADNNDYMAISNFYQHLYGAHGATVHVANQFMPL